MASPKRRLANNIEGDFYVDSTCIDCDTCRWMAPETFEETNDQSYVHQQPKTAEEKQRAFQALISCPTASIGTMEKHDLHPVEASFPIPITKDVYHCGYHAESSFGAASYLIQRPVERGGNLLVDSPRFSMPLIRRLEEMGGVQTLFLTHADDVADHERFAKHFRCRRVMHASEAPVDFELKIEGLEARALDPEILLVPTPGHTRGSTCLIYKNEFLFSGDHAAWSPTRKHVYAFRSACWFDWNVQIESMQRLAMHTFEWILPGHGRRCRFDKPVMQEQMQKCIEWMKTPS